MIAAINRDDFLSRTPITKAFPVGCQVMRIDHLWGDTHGAVTKHLTEGLIEITWDNGNTNCFHWALIDQMSIRRVNRRKGLIIELADTAPAVIETPPEPTPAPEPLKPSVTVRIDVPPDPIIESGDRVTFPFYCFGETRIASGIVIHAEKGIVQIQYQVSLPPKDAIAPIYYRAYPDNGVFEAEVQIPKDQIYVDAALHPINVGDWVSCRRQGKGRVVAFHPDRKTCVEVMFDNETTYWQHSSLTCVEKSLSKDFLLVKRKYLLDRLSEVRLSGDVAPPNCWIESSSTSKRLADGTKKLYNYWRVKAEKPIFKGEGGMTSIIHLGDDSTPKYKDWCDRMERRRKLNDVEHQLDQVERELQLIRG